MRFSIKYKVFVTLLAATTIVVIVMFALIRWSFDRGFIHYINTVEAQLQEHLMRTLTESYRRHGNWQFLQDNYRLWRELQWSSAARMREQRAQQSTPRGPPPPLRRRPFRARTALYDAEKKPVVGPPPAADDFALKPIKNNDTIIGYLGVRSQKRLSEMHDLRFSQTQGRAFLAISLSMIVISALIAWPLSRHLVQPLKRLTEATRALAAGDFNLRLQTDTSDELGLLSSDFNTLAKTLEANEKTRQQWFADFSHELRTPLAILLAEIEALQDRVHEVSTETLARLHRQVRHLSQLVNDLHELSLSDLGALDYHKEPVDVLALLRESIAMFRDAFAERQLTLETRINAHDSCVIFADQRRLRQLFSNLMSNTLRYTDAPGKMIISSERTTDRITIRFEDSAPGVAAEALPRLFERLFRVEPSRNRGSGGSGLGLAICKNIVAAHDGAIFAQPSDQGGLCVIIALPAVHTGAHGGPG